MKKLYDKIEEIRQQMDGDKTNYEDTIIDEKRKNKTLNKQIESSKREKEEEEVNSRGRGEGVNSNFMFCFKLFKLFLFKLSKLYMYFIFKSINGE